MTIRRLAAATLFSLGLLALAIGLATVYGGPSAAEALAASAQSVAITIPDPAPPATPEPTATPAPMPVPSPAVLVEIPADLISTPTPAAPTSVPLPMLTNIPATPRDASVVYLTFDDGPDPVVTNQILDVLAKYGAKATFFVIGNSVDAYPGTAARIVAEGHTLGNHTYLHEPLPLQTAVEIADTLATTQGAIQRAAGVSTTCLRPPYGALDEPSYQAVIEQGYSVSMWEVDSNDWRTGDSYTIASTVLTTTHLGDRILFHDGPSGRHATVTALDSVLDVLTTRGVQFEALPCS